MAGKASGLRPLLLIALALAFALGDVASPVTGGQAVAQQQNPSQKRMNLLDLIFGGALRPPMRRSQPADPPARRVIVAPPSDGTVTVARPPREAKVAVEKSENAARVLVVGDFMASGVQAGLDQAYADNPDVVFVDAASGLSGMVRDDVVDWPARLPALIDEHRPVAIIVLVGMNDRQQMRVTGGHVQKLSDEWRREYEARVEALARTAGERSLPLFWVGLPPVKSGAMNRDYLVFNEVYRAKVAAVDGKFIDIWDAFTGADGAFVSAGPDVNGQIVRLRNSDGINMTAAGKEKMAFYVERELRKVVSLGERFRAVTPGLDGPTGPLEPEYDPARTGRTMVVSLDGPSLDGGAVLEGGDEAAAGGDWPAGTGYDLVVRGLAPAPHKGRVDYVWGAPGSLAEADSASRANQ